MPANYWRLHCQQRVSKASRAAAQADVAQWQSNGFVNRRLSVRVRPSAPVAQRQGQLPKRSNGTDCKSVGSAFGGSNPPLPTGHIFLSAFLLWGGSSTEPATIPLPTRQCECGWFDSKQEGWASSRRKPSGASDDVQVVSQARVAQWQRTVLVRLGSWVQIPSRAPQQMDPLGSFSSRKNSPQEKI